MTAIAWCFVALVGIVIQAAYFRDTAADYAYWLHRDQPLLLAVADQHLTTATMRMLVVVANLALGVGSFFVAPHTPGAEIFDIIASLVLLLGEIALVTLTWLDRRLRRDLAKATNHPDLDPSDERIA